MRHQGHKSLQKHGISSSQQNNAQATMRKVRTLNLQTYKLHALGDYMEQIQTYGTVDSYSTQTVSSQGLLICLASNILILQGKLEHHIGKGRFTRTSRKVFIPQLASIERHQAQTHCIRAKLAALRAGPKESLPDNPEDHYHIGQTQCFPEDLMLFIRKHLDDPLTMVHRVQLILN